ncbi:sensor histidine kinase [Actinospica robiniae]|uniref:sensor histidine kinase n=1 Tax=Actinospica robiniae TaxID=304901 RepID=UPI001B7FA96B|nr:histidine kinase [Actinospica robiniae]
MKWLSRPAPAEQPRGLGRLLRAQGPAPRPGIREYLFDIVLAFLLASPMKAARNYSQVHLGGLYANMDVDKGTLVTFAFALLVPLCFRRRFPLTVLWAMMALLPLCPMPLVTIAIGLVISAYSATVYSPYRQLAYWLIPFAAVELFVLDYANLVPGNNLYVLPVAVPALAGLYLYGLQVRKDATGTVAEEQRRLEREQQDAIRLAVEEERARIARELHDVVTHNVSVMVVMAGAARKVLDMSPQQATDALLEVEAAGRAAMTELRQVMGLLTENPRDRHELAPQPGLDQIGALIKRIRATGVPIEYRVQGTPRPLPHGIDLTAYRVVQEALTNAIKHASGASIDIDVEYAPALLGLRIDDSGGVAGQTAASGNGRGLIGLKERVGVHGGTVEAGPRALGGYRVRVQLPLPAEDTV